MTLLAKSSSRDETEMRQNGIGKQKPWLLRDRVHSELREALLSGKHIPGEMLIESVLAQDFGVSKTPVHDALHRLAEEGMLKAIPRTGYLVESISEQDVREDFHLRLLLEVEAARLAAKRISDSQLEELRERERKLHHGGFKDPIQCNKCFHVRIARIAGNQKMAQIIENILDRLGRRLRLDPHMIEAGFSKEHERILFELEERDANKAKEAMRDHIVQTEERLLHSRK